MDLAHLPVDPLRTLLLGRALRLLESHQDQRVGHTVAQRFPGAYLGALAAGGRDQLGDRRHAVEVLDDHARVENGAAVFHDQAGDLAEGIGLEDAGIGRPDILEFEVVVDALFGHDDADLAHVWAGEGAQQANVLGHA